MKSTPLVFLIDGTNLTHALYHAMQAATLESIVEALVRRIAALETLKPRPTALSVAFDSPGESWRKKLYPAYKGHRPEKHADLVELLAAAADRVERNYEVLRSPGVEADDLIATRWAHAIDVGARVVLVSGDQDLYQLLRPASTTQLTKYKTSGGRVTDPRWTSYADVVDDHGGITPGEWPLYKALVGDKSDNIPGVKWIGPDAAAGLLRKFPTAAEWPANRWSLPLDARQLNSLFAAIADGSIATFERICTLDQRVPLDDEAVVGR